MRRKTEPKRPHEGGRYITFLGFEPGTVADFVLNFTAGAQQAAPVHNHDVVALGIPFAS
jgi:hypothetical protein